MGKKNTTVANRLHKNTGSPKGPEQRGARGWGDFHQLRPAARLLPAFGADFPEHASLRGGRNGSETSAKLFSLRL